jgi:hypothetical protein
MTDLIESGDELVICNPSARRRYSIIILRASGRGIQLIREIDIGEFKRRYIDYYQLWNMGKIAWMFVHIAVSEPDVGETVAKIYEDNT